MPRPRRDQIDHTQPGCYHLISRCVRRAFLCGGAATRRKALLQKQLQQASRLFAIDVLAYTLMDNHFHLAVRTDPRTAEHWTDWQVAERWCGLFPRRLPNGEYEPWSAPEIEGFANHPDWVAERRQRLASISWFMKTIKERIARQANKEDDCTGHFWEGRFKSIRLLDQAAVIGCMAYIDLNPIRAKITDRPETSDHTSIQDRIRSRQDCIQAASLAQAKNVLDDDRQAADKRAEQGPEHGLWISPMARCHIDGRVPQVTLDDYLELVDTTGRLIASGKRGAIPAHLRPILERLQIDADNWLAMMTSPAMVLGAAIGDIAARAAEAARRGLRWIADRADGLYQRKQQLQT